MGNSVESGANGAGAVESELGGVGEGETRASIAVSRPMQSMCAWIVLESPSAWVGQHEAAGGAAFDGTLTPWVQS